MEQFIDSAGYAWTLSYAYCACNIWLVAWQREKKYAGRCGRCDEGVEYAPVYWSREDTLERFRAEYGREPKGFETC